jgi:glutaredoxin-like protein NrdH
MITTGSMINELRIQHNRRRKNADSTTTYESYEVFIRSGGIHNKSSDKRYKFKIRRRVMDVTVYTLPNCVQCDMTKKTLNRHYVNYVTVDLSTDDQALQKIRNLGYQQAPVVITENNHWSGFKLDKIKDLAEITRSKGINIIMQTKAGRELFTKIKDDFGSPLWSIIANDIEKIEKELREQIIKEQENG